MTEEKKGKTNANFIQADSTFVSSNGHLLIKIGQNLVCVKKNRVLDLYKNDLKDSIKEKESA
jgi:hypothetical protein